MRENENDMDFVVPLKKVGLFTRAVLEGIELFYCPKRVFIVTNKEEIAFLKKELALWNVGFIEMIPEESFFVENYGLTIENLEKEFQPQEKSKDVNHREFGWWYQQMIKLGASTQIKDISRKYVVWDADLIPLEKWELAIKNENNNMDYYIPILQEQSKNDFNKEEYNKCILYLLGLECAKPKKEGTFVTHHMVFDVEYIKEMIEFIQMKKGFLEKWPLYFISLSSKFNRFSEYLLYSTFMMEYYKEEFLYHPYEKYGKTGIRFREPREIIQKIKEKYSFMPLKNSNVTLFDSSTKLPVRYKKDCFFSYQEIADYFSESESVRKPSYVQFEHVYYLL